MSFQHKYIKYKSKYSSLKKIITLSEHMEKSINSITNKNNSFVFMDIGFTKKQNKIISLLDWDIYSINKPNFSFNYCGMISTILLNKLTDYLSQFYPNTNKKISKILINNIVEPYLMATKKDSFWFEMRFIEPTASYDIPRWHQDGYFLPKEIKPNQSNINLRLIGVLFGSGTLFKKDNNQMVNDYLRLQKDLLDELNSKPKLSNTNENSIHLFDETFYKRIESKYRKIIDDELKVYPGVQLRNDQVVIFTMAPENDAAIHSEPKIDKPRLIFSIVTAEKEDIKQYADMTDQPFFDANT